MVGIQGDTLASKKAQGEWGEEGGNVTGGGQREVGKRGRRGYITATLTPPYRFLQSNGGNAGKGGKMAETSRNG